VRGSTHADSVNFDCTCIAQSGRVLARSRLRRRARRLVDRAMRGAAQTIDQAVVLSATVSTTLCRLGDVLDFGLALGWYCGVDESGVVRSMLIPFHVISARPILQGLGQKTEDKGAAKARTHPMSQQALSADRPMSAIRPCLIQA
jgi:hypothetical protein